MRYIEPIWLNTSIEMFGSFIYLLVIAFGLVIVFKFLIKDGKYKQLSMSMFYLIGISNLIVRLV